jgi:hypothetical protein
MPGNGPAIGILPVFAPPLSLVFIPLHPMKSFAYLLPVLLALGLSTGAYAQANQPATQPATQPAAQPAFGKPGDYCILKNGNMMMVMQGHLMTPMTADMTMKDGSMCLIDGTCKRPDGTLVKIK